MLEVNFNNIGVGRGFKIQKGVGWQFCALSNCFDNCAQKAYFKDGIFVVSSKWMTFRALDDGNTIYEVKLSAAEKGAIEFKVSNNNFASLHGLLREFQEEDKKVDIAAMLKDRKSLEKVKIGENVVDWPDSEPYTETLLMELDRNMDVLRFYLTVTYRPDYVESSSRGRFDWKTGSRVKTITLDEEVTFDFCNTPFMEVMKQIAAYCERKNDKLSFRCVDYMLSGHCIDIPQMIVESERFLIVFDFENVREVHVAESIMDSTYYTDTLGEKYFIGDIVRATPREIKYSTFVKGYGALNMLKWVYPKDEKYAFYCGFSL